MPRNTTRAGDYTGRKKQELAAKHAEEQRVAAANMALATAAAAVEDQEPVELKPRDMTPPPPPEPVVLDDAEVDDFEVMVQDVEVEEKTVKFRVNETLEMVTIGYGNNYDFEEGRWYIAPKHVYDHLEERGFIWH